MEQVSKINQFERMIPWGKSTSSSRRKINRKKRSSISTREKFKELARLAENTHKELVYEDSPFRLCVYMNGDDVFIDVVAINENNDFDMLFTQPITHTDPQKLIEHVNSRLGLMLDKTI